MPRPHRPNTNPARDKHGRVTNHPKQETRLERKARKRVEAEARNAATTPDRRRQARLAEARAEEEFLAREARLARQNYMENLENS